MSIQVLSEHMSAELMEPIPVGENPFTYEERNHIMSGWRVGNNLLVMYDDNDRTKRADYLDIVIEETGERIRINIT